MYSAQDITRRHFDNAGIQSVKRKNNKITKGVDLKCYRTRIGTLSPMRKGGRQSETTINGVTRGSVSFIKILLVAQGIHPNPGPRALPGRDEDASPAEPSPTDQSPTNNHHTDRNKVANNQNQQAQEKGKKIKQIHARMINDLAGYLRPGDNKDWNDFIALMGGHFTRLHRSDIKHVNDIFSMLEAKGIISYGCYDEIYEDFGRIHVELEKILQRGAEKIREVKECGQSGHMTGGPGHRTIQGIDSLATGDQRKIREIEDKLAKLEEEFRIFREEYKTRDENKDLVAENKDLAAENMDLKAENKALKERMNNLNTERVTEERNEGIHLGGAPTGIALPVGHTEVVRDIPDS